MVNEEQRKKLLEEAREAVTAKLQRSRSDISEVEQALFLVIEQELGLNRETVMNRLKMRKQEEFNRLVDEEYKRRLDGIEKKREWTTESFKAFEAVMMPVDPSDEKPLGWDYRFADELAGAKSATIREIFRYNYSSLADPQVLSDPNNWLQGVADKFDGKIVEHVFDRKEIDGTQWNDESTRYYKVSFKLRKRIALPKTPSSRKRLLKL